MEEVEEEREEREEGVEGRFVVRMLASTRVREKLDDCGAFSRRDRDFRGGSDRALARWA